ncbi:MAG: DNA polymerase [Nitrosopumilus sp.]|nr:DNA polymerase [Nitrosopumilus sp.]
MAEPIPVTDYKTLAKLYTKKKQNRDPAQSELREIHAIDTETWKGDVFLIADSDGRYLDKISPESVIKWLFCKKYESSWCFFYNLSYDAEVILKLLGAELNRYKRTRKLAFYFGKYRIVYYPSKCLKITAGHHSVIFYDIAQFYNNVSLSSAYSQNIGKISEKYLKLKNKRDEFSPTFYRRNTKQVRDYCIADCELTKQLAEHWIKLFHDAFSFYPAKWLSSGYLAEKVLINNGIEIPRFDSIPYDIQEMAYRSYYGGRFEILKRGLVGTAYLYDINSAYPYAISQIPDLSKGRWIKKKSIHPDAKLGFFRIRANIPDCKYVPPFPFRTKHDIIFPSGEFETYVTLAELQACESTIFYRILEGYQFIHESDTYPYRRFVRNLYQKRMDLKKQNNPLQLPIKIILNSIYGKTGQVIEHKIGNLFNPVIFASITGICRAQLYDFVRKNDIEKEVVFFATDSICTRKKLDIDSGKLGDFSFDGMANDVFVLQNGFYRFNGKWKQRGLGKLNGKEIEHLDTFEKDGRLYYSFNVLRSNRLRSAILQNRIKDIGKIKPQVREFNLNADRKRFWLGRIESIDDKIMNESMPLQLKYFRT